MLRKKKKKDIIVMQKKKKNAAYKNHTFLGFTFSKRKKKLFCRCCCSLLSVCLCAYWDPVMWLLLVIFVFREIEFVVFYEILLESASVSCI